MEFSTYLFIGFATVLVICGIFIERKKWCRKLLAGLLAILMLWQIGTIDTAGVKATQVGLKEKRLNLDFRDGVVTTMEQIRAGQMMMKPFIFLLLWLAVIPPLRKSKDTFDSSLSEV